MLSKAKIPDEQWDMPAGYSADGTRPVSLREVLSSDIPTMDLAQLSPDQLAELVAERIKRQPKFEVSMVGAGKVDKERAINEVKGRTDVGKVLVEVEQRLIRNLIQSANRPEKE